MIAYLTGGYFITMKKAILTLLCFTMLVTTVSCNKIDPINLDNTDKNKTIDAPSLKNDDTTNTIANNHQTTNYDTPDTNTTCTHTFSEWIVSKEATEREDGETIRVCSDCGHNETKLMPAKGTEGLVFTLSEDGTSYSVCAGSATEGDVFIPAYHNGLPVTSIGYSGMNDDEFDTFEMGDYAFLYCNNLTNIVIPSTVTVIGDMAFARCERLENIMIPSTVTIIGDGAFAFCKSLEHIVLPPAVTVIGDGAFMLCESLENITIPQSVTEIGELAFALSEQETPLGNYHSDIKFSVPNTQLILILREFSHFHGWGVEIYYLDENRSEILIEKISFEDGSRTPFSNGDFEIINNDDNTFSVRAEKHGSGEGWMIEKIFDIPQCVSIFVPKAEDTVTVFYGGNNSEAWDKINIASGNTRLEKDNLTVKRSVIYYYSETEPNESNKFWHYVDGIPTVW